MPSAVARSPLRSLPPDALARFATRRIARGDVLAAAGDPPERVALVVHGALAVRLDDVALGLVGPGELVGAAEALAGLPHSVTTAAVTDADVLEIPAADLRALCREHPDLALALAEHVAGQLVAANRRIGIEAHDPWRIVVVGPPADGSKIAADLAKELADRGPTAVTLAPDPRDLPRLLDLPAGADRHPDGFDLVLDPPGEPLDVHLLAVCARLREGWRHAVVVTPELHPALLEGAHAAVLLGGTAARLPPDVQRLDPDLDGAAMAARLGTGARIALYIPERAHDGRASDREVEATTKLLGERFGGATVSDATGAWHSDTDGLVTEGVLVVSTWAERGELMAHLDEVVRHVEGMRESLQQEAMAIEVAGRFMVI